MDFSTIQAGLGLMGSAIAWLTAELLRRDKANAQDRAERKVLFDAHIADLKGVIATQTAALARYQTHVEESTQEAAKQERASMVVIMAMGDKMAAMQSEVRQTLTTALSIHRP